MRPQRRPRDKARAVVWHPACAAAVLGVLALGALGLGFGAADPAIAGASALALLLVSGACAGFANSGST